MRYFTIYLFVFLISLVISSCNKNNNSVGPNELSRWTQVNGLPTFQNIVTVNSNLVAAGYDGVFVSTDNGANWYASSLLWRGGDDIYSAAAIAGNVIVGDTCGTGIFLSSDYGSHWIESDSGLPKGTAIFCLTAVGGSVLTGTGDGVFKSTDAGMSWIKSNNGIHWSLPTYSFTSFAVNGDTAFVAIGDAIYRSTDDGVDWTEVDNAAFVDTLGTNWVVSLALSGRDIFAGTSERGVFVSTDGGDTWKITSRSPAPSNLFPYVQLAAIDSSIFAACGGVGLFRTTDNGGSWNSILDNLPPGTAVDGVAALGNELFITTTTGAWRQRF